MDWIFYFWTDPRNGILKSKDVNIFIVTFSLPTLSLMCYGTSLTSKLPELVIIT